jgi:hypothetical protein
LTTNIKDDASFKLLIFLKTSSKCSEVSNEVFAFLNLQEKQGLYFRHCKQFEFSLEPNKTFF